MQIFVLTRNINQKHVASHCIQAATILIVVLVKGAYFLSMTLNLPHISLTVYHMLCKKKAIDNH